MLSYYLKVVPAAGNWAWPKMLSWPEFDKWLQQFTVRPPPVLSSKSPMPEQERTFRSLTFRPGVADAPAMDEEDIARTIAGFVSAAKRAQQAGCDGVQIHAAHGYLLSTFLSPLFNRRTDDWGGSTARRARIVLDIVSGIRHVTGDQFPILIKMNAADFVDGGLQPSEMIEIAGMLEQAGLDAVEMSGGTPLSGKQNPIRVGDDSVWYRDAAEQFKKKLALPLILVGGIRRAASAEDLLNQGICDAVALSRPLIRQPDLPDIWRNDAARNADCISCNRCMVPMRNGQGLYCPLLAKAKV